MTKIDEIAKAHKAGIPNLALYREIERLRLNAITSYTKELRDSAMQELAKTVIKARRIQKARAFIVFANFLFEIAALSTYILVAHFGYSRLVAPPFGLPEVDPFDVFLAVFLVKFMWKGYASYAAIEKREKERKKEEAMLWHDRTKMYAKTNAYNIGGSLMAFLFFYGFTLFS